MKNYVIHHINKWKFIFWIVLYLKLFNGISENVITYIHHSNTENNCTCTRNHWFDCYFIFKEKSSNEDHRWTDNGSKVLFGQGNQPFGPSPTGSLTKDPFTTANTLPVYSVTYCFYGQEVLPLKNIGHSFIILINH